MKENVPLKTHVDKFLKECLAGLNVFSSGQSW